MKKKSFSLIIGLMTVALMSVIAMQAYFLRISYTLKAELFDQAVNASLVNVVAGLQKHEALFFLQRNKPGGLTPVRGKIMELAQNGKITGKELTAANLPDEEESKRFIRLLDKKQRESDHEYDIYVDSILSRFPKHLQTSKVAAYRLTDNPQLKINMTQLEDEQGNVLDQRVSAGVVPGDIITKRDLPKRFAHLKLPPRQDTIDQYLVRDSFGRTGKVEFTKPVINNVTLASNTQLINRIAGNSNAAFKSMSTGDAKKLADSVMIGQKKMILTNLDLAKEWQSTDIPFRKRIRPLDSLLKRELIAHGIKMAYKTQVDSAKTKPLITRASLKTEPLPDNVYKTTLFPGDFNRDGGALTLSFPDKNNVILTNMAAMMGASGALSLVLMCCFGYTLYSILRQKKISEMKTDFINNMTHEFKTPVSTIMIASEGLKDPGVSADKSRVARLAGIIYDENIRLANHIERVLNIAKIDREDLKLEQKPVEMNELVAAVTDSMALQLQKREAKLTLQLNATRQTLVGDELHLSNVLYNLVDNAIKYSREQPEIAVTTLNAGGQLIIRIADKGIGMSKDQLSKIFDQFYRIPTGNLHDVKGFGLGLSYVNNIVKRLNGTVRVKSEKDNGSEFELIFPVV